MWITPKTDWNGDTVEGKYVGDYFNVVDFNRIKNNILHVYQLSLELYPHYDIPDLGYDRHFEDFIYVRDFENFRQSLSIINANTLMLTEVRNLAPGMITMVDYNELNRIEDLTRRLYDSLANRYYGRRTFTFNFEKG